MRPENIQSMPDGGDPIPVAERVDVIAADSELVEPIPVAQRARRARSEDGPDDGLSERLAWWVRTFLILIAVGLVAVLGVGAWLNPYDADGQPRLMATHMQLGLPPCNMVQWIGKPCPSCGMTTSFALLIRGDVWNSLRANWVGTLLALGCFAFIPWSLLSAARGRYLLIRNGELWLSLLVMLLLLLMLGRWVYVLCTWETSV